MTADKLRSINMQFIPGWISVNRNERRIYDLEGLPLEVKTDSELGSNEALSVRFFSPDGEAAGGVDLRFSTPVQYYLTKCKSSRTDLPTDPPSDRDKVWRISLDRSSGIKVVIHSNDVEVLRVTLSDTECDSGEWSGYWSKDVGKIQFDWGDSASDFYRPQPLLGD